MCADGLKQALREKNGRGWGGDGEKLVGMGWVWREQVVPVQLSTLDWNAPSVLL